MDGLLHGAGGRTQYADFSGWDTYRTQIQLLAMLIAAARERHGRARCSPTPRESGCLPRWSYANGQSMTMVGDSADPMIASASAFGARDFDRRRPRAMVKGATRAAAAPTANTSSARGSRRTWRSATCPSTSTPTPQRELDLRQTPTPSGARRRPRSSTRSTTSRSPSSPPAPCATAPPTAPSCARSGNWRKLLNPRSGMIEPRFEDGAFPPATTTCAAAASSRATRSSTPGWCPTTRPASSPAIGGRARAAGRLDRFLRKLNGGAGGTHTDHALLGNEPNLHVPWLYNWTRQPYKTQAAVRRALRLYGTAPAGYPGNDDLGTLSSWYVFGALGLYPEVPGVGVLAIGSPLFGRRRAIAHGRRLGGAVLGRGEPRSPLPPGPLHQRHALQRPPLRPALDHLLRAGPGGRPHLPARGAPQPPGAIPPPPCRPPSAPVAPMPKNAAPPDAAQLRANVLWALAGLTALGVAVRFASLGVQSYHHDEVITAMRVIPGSFGQMLREVKASESNPPLYYVLAWGWAKAFGTGEVGLRSLTALFGAATVPVAYLSAGSWRAAAPA